GRSWSRAADAPRRGRVPRAQQTQPSAHRSRSVSLVYRQHHSHLASILRSYGAHYTPLSRDDHPQILGDAGGLTDTRVGGKSTTRTIVLTAGYPAEHAHAATDGRLRLKATLPALEVFFANLPIAEYIELIADGSQRGELRQCIESGVGFNFQIIRDHLQGIESFHGSQRRILFDFEVVAHADECLEGVDTSKARVFRNLEVFAHRSQRFKTFDLSNCPVLFDLEVAAHRAQSVQFRHGFQHGVFLNFEI